MMVKNIGILLLCYFYSLTANCNERKLIITFHGTNYFSVIEELVSKAYENIGFNAKIVQLPYGHSLYEYNTNDWVDAELVRSEAAGNKLTHFIKVPVPLYKDKIVAISYKKLINIDGWDDLNKYQLGTLRGFIAAEVKLKHYEVTNIK